MGSYTRRQLSNEENDQYDPYLSFNVDEYLITHWPGLTSTERKGVWVTLQNSDDFDFSDVEFQVDQQVNIINEQKDTPIERVYTDDELEQLNTLDEDEDESEDSEEGSASFIIDVHEYLENTWYTLTQDQHDQILQTIFEYEDFDFSPIYETIDEFVFAAAEEDESIEFPQEYFEDEESDSEDTEQNLST